MYRKVQLRQKSDKADYRAIAFYDTPLKGICIVSTVDIHYKGYLISGQRVSPFGKKIIISVSFEICSYLPIRRIRRRSLLVTFIVG